MNATLNINLEPHVFECAKNYAFQKQMSLSQLVEKYLEHLVVADNSKIATGRKVNPIVEQLTGVITIDGDDYKNEYREYLHKKYL